MTSKTIGTPIKISGMYYREKKSLPDEVVKSTLIIIGFDK
jgi:hypothetical protein